MAGVRIDKWLWAARFFKTRSLAAKACDLGKIRFHGQPTKPAREVHAGDMLQVKNDSGDFEVEVLLLSDIRGPAVVAQTLYRETEFINAGDRLLFGQEAEDEVHLWLSDLSVACIKARRSIRSVDLLTASIL